MGLCAIEKKGPLKFGRAFYFDLASFFIYLKSLIKMNNTKA